MTRRTSTGSRYLKDQDRLILIDPSVLGQSHVLVNLGVLRLCSELFSEVYFLAEDTHVTALRKHGTDLVNVVFLSYTSRKTISVRMLEEIDPSCPILFLNLEYMLFTRLMCGRVGRHRTVIWTLHSHFARRERGWRARLKLELRRALLFKLVRNANFVVYGRRIRENLLDLLRLPADDQRILPVTHPLGFRPIVTSQVRTTNVQLLYMKGWHSTPPIISNVVEELRSVAQSRPGLSMRTSYNDIRRLNDGARRLDDDYLERMSAAEGANFLLYIPINDYALQASGAFMDAFVNGCPLFGVSTQFEREITALVGPVGYFFDTHEDLVRGLAAMDLAVAIEDSVQFRRNLEQGSKLVMLRARRELSVLFRVSER